MYISFTVGLTCAISDVDVTSATQRRGVLVHSLISFFFYTTILGVVLNAIMTSYTGLRSSHVLREGIKPSPTKRNASMT